MIGTLSQDVQYSLRMLRKSPGFTIVAVLTLALGIGANAAIFSMVNALLLHPYNFRNLDQLVRVWENNKGLNQGYDARWMAPADALDLRAETQVFAGLTTYRYSSFNLATLGGAVQPVLGCLVSSNFFDVLGVSPAVGRTFTAREEQPGLDRVVIVSQGFWQRQFGRDPSLLGKTLQLNGLTYTVVGIMPPRFDYPVPVELWVPLALAPAETTNRTQLSVAALGRLKPGVSLGQAHAALDAFGRRLEQEYPQTNSGRSTALLRLREELYLYTVPLFGLLQGAAAFVLLLACANLANLLFARMMSRQKEIAVRTALGASRGRLARLFLSETVLFSLLAGGAAVAAASWGAQAIRTSIPEGWTKWVPGWDQIQLDRSVLAFALLLSVMVGILFGLVTALESSRADLNRTLKEAGGAATIRRSKLRSALVVVQVTFALVLLVGAGLLIQGFRHVADIYQGFQPAGVLTSEVSLPERAYPDDTKSAAFYQQALAGVAALPGVESAGLATNLPASNVDNERTFFTIEGRPALRASETPAADLQTVNAGFFRSLRIPLRAGRIFSDADNASGARVAVISESAAEHFWLGESPLGRRLKLGAADSAAPWATVVGVVGDVRQNWWDAAAKPAIYLPFLQAPQRGMYLVLRASSNPTGYVPAVRDIVQRIDPEIAGSDIQSMDGLVADSIAILRIMGILMGVFGGVALALSAVGLYGVLAHTVSQQMHEFGIRLALGAHPRDVLRLVFGQALKLSGIGLAVGSLLAYGVSRAMASLVFGIVGFSSGILAGIVLVLLCVALAASYFPARRAMRVDPLKALRYE